MWYPLLFYQLPELVPTLAIAAGISPPNGVLKRLLAGAWALCCCASGGASAYASSDFASSASASTRRTRASQRSQRRAQQTSVGSSASYLSSLTGGTSLHSGPGDAQPPALALPAGAAAASAGSKLAPIAEHEQPGSPQGSSVATSSLAASQQSAASLERHVGGSLTQQLQLPLHLQQQLQIAQLQHQHQQLLQFQQNPLIPSQAAQAAGRVDSPPPVRALSSAARDSDASLLLGRLSELQTEPRHSDATAAPGGVQVQRSQSSSATHSVDSHRPKASFSIASSPVNGGLTYPHRAFGASQREEVLVDDVLDGSRDSADAFDERALPRSAPSQPQTPVVWSPLTGTSLASSAGAPLVGSQQSSLPQSLPSSARSQSSSRHLRGALPPLHAQSQSSSQQRAGLISLLFGRRGAGASASSQRPPRSVDEDFDDERQQSADYAELLYRLNSYVPERLHSADALYTNMDAALLQRDHVGAAALAAAGLGAHEDAPPVVSASEEGEHALAAYLAPKSRWARGPDAGDADADADVEQARPSDGDGSVQSGGSGSGKRRQSALSKSWLHKVMG